MAFPFVAVSLARNGEFQIGVSVGTNLRLFMVQEEEANGIGIALSRSKSSQTGDCVQTSLSYFLWEGEGESSRYCQCYDDIGNLSANVCP